MRKNSINCGRFFIPNWFEKFPWLTFCPTRNSAFCKLCTKFDISSSVFVLKNQISEGFRNWKKGVEKLQEHEKSQYHRQSVVKEGLAGSKVDAQLSEQLRTTQELRREGTKWPTKSHFVTFYWPPIIC
jgi:hypothetical protein